MNTPADKPDLPAPAGIESYPWYLWLERRYGPEIARRIIHETLAAFLERSGQWLTNDATHKAALDEARAQARAELIAERDAAFNRGMFVAAGIAITAYDLPTVAGEIIQAVGPEAVKDVDEYDASVLAPHFPEFAPYAPKE